MTHAPSVSPELVRSLSSLARALVAAGRSWGLYPPNHPAVTSALERLGAAIEQASAGGGVALGVTPETLLVDGIPLPAKDSPVVEAAALLHDRDILEMSFASTVPTPALREFLTLLNLDATVRRQRGGPERIWAESGDPSIEIRQVDYQAILEDREAPKTAARGDDVWFSIVRAVVTGQPVLDQGAQQRLLEIAGDADAIGALAEEAMDPQRTPDGSPLLTTRAATVLRLYRHLTNVVRALAPDRLPDVMRKLALATEKLDPHVALQLMQAEEISDASGEIGVIGGVARAFDDTNVAQLLATTLALEGRASSRLAQVFATIAPDAERKRRVLKLTKSLLTESDFGKLDDFQTVWSSMEELLLTSDERPSMSAAYRLTIDGVTARADAMAGGQPPETAEWIASLDQEHVRQLSVTLLIDLLSLERDPARMGAIADDMTPLVEDLLLAGDYHLTLDVVRALARIGRDPARPGQAECRAALENLGSTPALRDAALLIDRMTDAEYATFAQVCAEIGPSSIDALRGALEVDTDTVLRQRGTTIILGFGPEAIARLAPLLNDPNSDLRRNVVNLLGNIGTKEIVPVLQPLLRSSDLQVLRETIRALSHVNDPSANRAIQTALRAASGDTRRVIVETLITERDVRVVPALAWWLEETKPLGPDYGLVLETIETIGKLGGDAAVAPIAAVIRVRRWFARRKVKAIKQAGIAALVRIGTPQATAAIDEAARVGDRLLRRIAARAGKPTIG